MQHRTVIVNSMLGSLLAVGSVVGVLSVGTKKAPAATTTEVAVSRGSVQTSVTATGNVLSATQVNVSFENAVSTNVVTQILVKVGDKVKKGQPLARVDATTVRAALASAQAQLASAQAALDKVQAGLSAPERAQLEVQAEQSAASLANAQQSLANALANAEQARIGYAENIRQADQSLANLKSQAERDVASSQTAVDQAQLTYDGLLAGYNTAKTDYDAAAAAVVVAAEVVARYVTDQLICDSGGVPIDGVNCSDVATFLSQARADKAPQDAAANSAKAALDKLTPAFNQASMALANATNGLATTKLKSQQSIDSSTNSTVNARNSQASGLLKDGQSIISAQQQVNTARLALESTTNNNLIKLAIPSEADQSPQRASIINAQNSLATAQKNVDATTLIAPADGTVSIINGLVGALGSNVSAGTTTTAGGGGGGTAATGFITLSDLAGLEVKVGFSEADAVKVRADQVATITIDAITGTRVSGVVRAIDTTSSTVSNVVTFYAYVKIDNPPATVKPGMTASVQVELQRVDDVLTLPVSAVTARTATATVSVKTAGTRDGKELRTITVGTRGDQSVEISNGLNEGDIVIVTRATATAGTAGTRAGTGTLTGAGGAGAGGIGGAGATGPGGAAVGGRRGG